MISDEQLRTAVEEALAALRAPLEAGLRSCTDSLHKQTIAETAEAVRAAVERARQEAAAQLEAARNDADRRLSELARASQEELDQARQRFETELAAARDTAAAEVSAARAQAAAAAEEARSAARELAALAERADAEVDDARRTAAAQVEDVQRIADERVASARRELDGVRQALNEAQRMLEKSRTEADEVRRQLDAAHAEMGEVRARSAEEAQALVAVQVAAAFEMHQRRLDEGIARVRAENREAALAHGRQLIEGMRALDAAASLGGVLDRLAALPHAEHERLQLFVVKAGRLQPWRPGGISPGASADMGIVEGAESGIAGEALRSARPVVRQGGEPLPGLRGAGGAGERRLVAAMPVMVGGTPVAVLYAETPATDAMRDARWPALLEALTRYAGRVLESLALQRTAVLTHARAAARRMPDRAGRSVG